MSETGFLTQVRQHLVVGASLVALCANLAGPMSASAAVTPAETTATASPIKHVIVIIGENRSFDHVFATYVPKSGQTVSNLLSEGIVKADGTPGPNFSKAEQRAAADQAPDAFLLSPPNLSFRNNVLPAPLVGGPAEAVSYIPGNTIANAMASEAGLPTSYYPDLVSGGTLLTSKTPDTRITNVNSLPRGPFQLTNGKTFTYDSYAASPVHRFYQMWQQLDCSAERVNFENPSGCNSHLFAWVEVATGAGSSKELNGLPQPADFSTEF